MSPDSVMNRSLKFGRLVAIAAVSIVGAVACALLYNHNPSGSHFYPRCMFHELTGFYCPGCGSTRAMYQLLHGHIGIALRDNLLFCVAVPSIAAYLLVNNLRPGFFGARFSLKARYIGGMCLFFAILLFWAFRNIPVYPFTLLAPPN